MHVAFRPSHGAPMPLQKGATIYVYIKDDRKSRRTRPPDRNGGATRPGDHEKACAQSSRSEFCTPAFPFPVQDACGLRDGRRRTRKGDASDVARLEQSRGRAARGGSSPPNARQHHSARDFRRRSARRLSSGIEGLPGPPSRTSHPGHGSKISELPQTETLPATAGCSRFSSKGM
jgi:hypothetical protein